MGLFNRRSRKQESPKFDTAEDRGTTWVTYAERQLKDEQARFASLDSKGNTLVTSSGTFVTLIFAVGAITLNRTDFQPSNVTVVLALFGLALFVLAAIMGVATTSMATYTAVSSDLMESIRTSARRWNMTERAARRYTMKYDIIAVRTLRVANKKKAWKLRAGHVLQVAGALVLTASAGTAMLYNLH